MQSLGGREVCGLEDHEVLREYMRSLCKDKKYLFCLGITLFLGYGFYFTYDSIYIDDTAMGRYYAEGRVLRQGRWGMWLWSWLVGQTEYRPFINKACGVLLLFFACMLMCCLFLHVSKKQVKSPALILFSCIMVSYSLINEILFYVCSQWTCSLIYIFAALAVWFLMLGITKRNVIAAVSLLTLAISFTEIGAAVYIILIIGCMLTVQLFQSDRLKTVFACVKEGIVYGAVLIAAIVIERAVAVVLCLATGYELSARSTLWMNGDLLYVVKSLLNTMGVNYGIRALFYVPIAEYLIVFLVNIGIVIYFAVKKQAARAFLWFMFLVGSIVFSVIQGEAAPNRAIAQVFAIYIAFLCASLLNILWSRYQGKVLCHAVTAGFVLLVVWQVADLNTWEYVNYMRHVEETSVIHDLGRELEQNYDTDHKPVVFVGKYQLSENILQYTHVKHNSPKDRLASHIMGALPVSLTYPASQVDMYGYQFNETGSNSVIAWGVRAFGEVNTELLKNFALNGYTFIQGKEEIYLEALEQAEDMAVWPKEGAICENDSYIVVKLGN